MQSELESASRFVQRLGRAPCAHFDKSAIVLKVKTLKYFAVRFADLLTPYIYFQESAGVAEQRSEVEEKLNWESREWKGKKEKEIEVRENDKFKRYR